MKKIFTGCLCICMLPALGQSKQIKLYLQQIAANAVYIEYLQKGHKIARQGLTIISNIKDGHFSLDKDFFAGLENVNPHVANYAKVRDIITINICIVKQYKKSVREAKMSERFTDQELEHIGSVFNTLIDNCTETVDVLITLLTTGELKMSDDERIKRIDVLHAQMQNNSLFVQAFSGDLRVMALQRMKELNDASSLRMLYGQ